MGPFSNVLSKVFKTLNYIRIFLFPNTWLKSLQNWTHFWIFFKEFFHTWTHSKTWTKCLKTSTNFQICIAKSKSLQSRLLFKYLSENFPNIELYPNILVSKYLTKKSPKFNPFSNVCPKCWAISEWTCFRIIFSCVLFLDF